jgi:hypothetical protein
VVQGRGLLRWRTGEARAFRVGCLEDELISGGVVGHDHSSIAITLDTYSRMLPTMQESVPAEMEDVFSKLCVRTTLRGAEGRSKIYAHRANSTECPRKSGTRISSDIWLRSAAFIGPSRFIT